MTSEPTHDEVHEDDNDTATKGFVRSELRSVETNLRTELKKFIREEAKETRPHFDVVAENIHKDVAGANADEISLIKDQKLPDHEDRIVDLEEHTGLPVGPRH